MKNKHALVLSIALLLSVSIEAQISFSNQTATLLSDQTVYSGCAMAIADMNGDTLDDIIRLENARILKIEYQQPGGGVFGSLNYGTMGTGSQWSMCIADVDGNGYNDILTGGAYNGLKLLTANSSGSNYSLTTITNPSIFLQGSNFADINNDGSIDIFACHDDGLSAPFKNDGAGNFTHDIGLIDASSTVPSDNSGNYGTVWTDYDNDGDLDMYLSKCRLGVGDPMDGRRINMLFQNDGSNNYTDVAEAAGLRPLAQSWAADFADIDNDGDLDCFIANHDIVSQLYKNNGDGTFTDITASSGMSADLAAVPAGIQCIFDDFDNDGFVDLLYTSLNNEHRLFKNNGDLTFTTVTSPFPDNGWGIQSAVTGDLNNDGYLDVYAGFANGYNGPNSSQDDLLFINDESGNNYLKLLLKGDAGTNINAIGTRVEIYGPWGVQVREIRSGESYGIMTSMVLHFGLGSATSVDQIIIRWPNGAIEEMCGIDINQTMVMTENNLPSLLNSEFTFDDDGYDVTFTDISTGIPDDWLWDFGDGTSSTDQNPMHTYLDEGPYTITLTISNDCETESFNDVWEWEGILPLDLLSFSANIHEKDNVMLQWRSENENAFDHFKLERSTNLIDFKTIANVTGKNGLSENQYEWIDRTPELGDNYYRLRLVDADGTYHFSDWQSIKFDPDQNELKVYPNPTRDKLFVATGETQVESFSIFDTKGSLIMNAQELSGDFEINLSGWESGIYFLQVKTMGESRFIRFSKI
jgi:ASPIC/UnbV protein/PKD domain-containing protein/VCBS repeat protein/type IX secretion system substrate protein